MTSQVCPAVAVYGLDINRLEVEVGAHAKAPKRKDREAELRALQSGNIR